MKIHHRLLPSGITDGIPLLIEARWTPEQAVAVLELLDDLRAQRTELCAAGVSLLQRRPSPGSSDRSRFRTRR